MNDYEKRTNEELETQSAAIRRFLEGRQGRRELRRQAGEVLRQIEMEMARRAEQRQ